jgi:hypothetical protein
MKKLPSALKKRPVSIWLDSYQKRGCERQPEGISPFVQRLIDAELESQEKRARQRIEAAVEETTL